MQPATATQQRRGVAARAPARQRLAAPVRPVLLRAGSGEQQRAQEAAPPAAGAAAGAEDTGDINDRILSGEFTDSGSTKEKLTRPLRKALAKDPTGLGERAAGARAARRGGSGRHVHWRARMLAALSSSKQQRDQRLQQLPRRREGTRGSRRIAGGAEAARGQAVQPARSHSQPTRLCSRNPRTLSISLSRARAGRQAACWRCCWRAWAASGGRPLPPACPPPPATSVRLWASPCLYRCTTCTCGTARSSG